MEIVPEMVSSVSEAGVGRVVKLLRTMLGHGNKHKNDAVPKDLPAPMQNTTGAADYKMESLSDPGIIGGVTGTGYGPEIKM